MRSRLPREVGLIVALILTPVVGSAADDMNEAKAKAALALAKAKRERMNPPAPARLELPCHTDYAKAAAEAEKTGKPLVLWVAVECAEYPDLRKALDKAVHCHVKERRGTPEPAVVIVGGDGNEYYVRPAKITANTADKIKSKWELPYIPPIRFDVRISEEFSRRNPTMPVTTARVAAVNNTWWPGSMATARTPMYAPYAGPVGGTSYGGAGCTTG